MDIEATTMFLLGIIVGSFGVAVVLMVFGWIERWPSACPKCGGSRSGLHKHIKYHSDPQGDYLGVTCNHCGYAEQQKCADKRG